MDGGALSAGFDLVAATGAVGDDERVAGAWRTAGKRLRSAIFMETS